MYQRYKQTVTRNVRAYNLTLRGRYHKLVEVAKRMGWPCLGFEEYVTIVSQPCCYCRMPIESTVGYSLDRKDNAPDYTAANVVPCCKMCNATKSDLWSHDEFVEIGAVIGRLKQNRQAAS